MQESQSPAPNPPLQESPSLGRRHFLKTTGLTAAMLAAARFDMMAGPFTNADFDKIIPADKKLGRDWIASLYARGEALSATGQDLQRIGMPINGITTGQVYLGGDGKLWYWNLDGVRDKGVSVKGPRFLKPDIAHSPFSQGFALQVGGKAFTLDSEGFKKVVFTNEYPMGRVDYTDSSCPLAVRLEAYTPFIPLNRDDSSHPVIVMRYTLKNTSSSAQQVSIAGWIENISNLKSGGKAKGQKIASYRELDEMSAVECSAEFKDAKMNKAPDNCTFALGIFGNERPEIVDLALTQEGAEGLFSGQKDAVRNGAVEKQDFSKPAYASLGRTFTLQPGETKTVSFSVAWHFPIIQYANAFGMKTVKAPSHYGSLGKNATEMANAVAKRETELYETTRKWTDTWYDSTLPYWFLERTFIPNNCVQTQVAQRIAETGKTPEFYNFLEGVQCCPGNCTHVWHYAQGLARIFPQIERECRDKIEYGMGFDPKTGSMQHRYTEAKFGDAVDGNCGTILRVLRESQMTTDYRFLESIWDRVKLSMDHVIEKWDKDENGLLEGSQHNTLDEPWFGQVHWLINLYHAALKASAVMARQMKQPAVAERYEKIVAKGAPAMVGLLWSDEFGYFIHKPGPAEDQKHGSTNGCHIDQVLGDSWLWNIGLEGILPKEKVRAALEALWTYNFTPDVGVFRKTMKEGRWYAEAGNAGLVMCSFPNGKIEPKSGKASYAGYLNECMTGFEWQVAAHMIWEGMTEKGLAIGKAIYDRYLPRDRNPYNEIECSDHYSRAMSAYGAFLAMCGYQYDGPEGRLAFGPRLQQEDFRAAFTTAEGWGQFSQKVTAGKQSQAIDLHYGVLSLKEIAFDQAEGTNATSAQVSIDGTSVAAAFQTVEKRYILHFQDGLNLKAGQKLEIHFA
ncbi:MAG: GH116 family glycosyl-hydrolase [Luteolibacter sp.]